MEPTTKEGTTMRTTRFITATALAFVLTAGPALAAGPTLEEGATFNGPTCVEADGTAGVSALDGSCVTPADYDAIFNYDNLDTIPSQVDPTRSVADVSGMERDYVAPSDRKLGDGLVAPQSQYTFKEYVKWYSLFPYQPINIKNLDPVLASDDSGGGGWVPDHEYGPF